MEYPRNTKCFEKRITNIKFFSFNGAHSKLLGIFPVFPFFFDKYIFFPCKTLNLFRMLIVKLTEHLSRMPLPFLLNFNLVQFKFKMYAIEMCAKELY